MSGSAQPYLTSEMADLIRKAISWDGAARKREYIISGRTRHFRVSESACFILQRVLSGDTFAQIAGTINAQATGSQVTEEQVESACLRLIAQLEADRDDAEVKPKAFGFWGRRQLFPKDLVLAIARPMSALYGRWPAGLLLIFTLCISIIALKGGGTRMPHTGYLAAYLLFLLSLMVHEFGHAAACCRFGQEPNEIGFTVYLIYPALYSNVTSAWRLARWQRVVVDAGGIFFQSIIASTYMGLYWITGWDPFRFAFLMVLLSVAWSLNPLFKYDGYWILSDLLGVANLHRQMPLVWSHFWNRLRGRAVPLLPWPGKIIAVLLVYSVCTSLAWTLFSWRLLQSLLVLFTRLPHSLASMGSSVWAGTFPATNDLRTCVAALLLLPLPMMIAVQIIRRLWVNSPPAPASGVAALKLKA